MHDVTWRTGLTFTILALLVLLGSGWLVQPADPAPTATPTPTGEVTRSASSMAGLSTQPAGHDGAPPSGAVRAVRVLRQPGGPVEIWR